MPRTKTTKTELIKKTKSSGRKNPSIGDIKVFDMAGKEVDRVNLPKQVAAVQGSDALIAQAVRVYASRQRSGTKMAKTRGEVSGSTRKIFRQKGTGHARHGSTKAPIFIGGGAAHGPRPVDYHLQMPKTMRRKALSAALVQQAKSGNLIVIKGMETVTGKTKEIATLLRNLALTQTPSAVLVLGDNEQMIARAGRNVPHLTVIPARMLNVYTVLSHRNMLMTEEAMKVLASKKETV